MVNDYFYKVSDIAKHLMVSRSTVWNWITLGKLKSVKFGNKKTSTVRIRKVDLDEFIEDSVRY